jgi:hypothetical protein
MTVLIQLTTAGTDTGPFNLYSDLDSFGVPFEVGVSKVDLLAGYLSLLVPDFTTTIRVCSTSLYCANCIDITVEPLPTTTTTSSSSTSTSTTTSTTTSITYYTFSLVFDPCSSATPTFTAYSSSSSLGVGVSIWQDTALTVPYNCSAGGPGNFCFIGLASNPLGGYWRLPDGSNVIDDTGSCS